MERRERTNQFANNQPNYNTNWIGNLGNTRRGFANFTNRQGINSVQNTQNRNFSQSFQQAKFTS